MTLAKRLEAIRTAFTARIDDHTRAIVHRAAENLRASGIRDRILGVGKPLPAFALANHHGQRRTSAESVGDKSLVLTFFRGHW